jgi:hypothetical protein
MLLIKKRQEHVRYISLRQAIVSDIFEYELFRDALFIQGLVERREADRDTGKEIRQVSFVYL